VRRRDESITAAHRSAAMVRLSSGWESTQGS
jgi:hypothetical protein